MFKRKRSNKSGGGIALYITIQKYIIPMMKAFLKLTGAKTADLQDEQGHPVKKREVCLLQCIALPHCIHQEL